MTTRDYALAVFYALITTVAVLVVVGVILARP